MSTEDATGAQALIAVRRFREPILKQLRERAEGWKSQREADREAERDDGVLICAAKAAECEDIIRLLERAEMLPNELVKG